MALCSWLSFVDRQVLTILAPTIIRDTGLTNQNFTDAASFFFLAYTLGNPVWGSVLDRVGLRVGMLLGVAIWTGASASHAFMGSFLGFAMARGVLGLGEGVTFPGGLRTARPPPAHLRARAIALSFRGTIGADDAAAPGAACHSAWGRRSSHRRSRRHGLFFGRSSPVRSSCRQNR
jgi:ACS family hexuronate transporter-like MFS transporter